MAASMVMTLPVVAMFFMIQRYFVGTVTASATEG